MKFAIKITYISILIITSINAQHKDASQCTRWDIAKLRFLFLTQGHGTKQQREELLNRLVTNYDPENLTKIQNLICSNTRLATQKPIFTLPNDEENDCAILGNCTVYDGSIYTYNAFKTAVATNNFDVVSHFLTNFDFTQGFPLSFFWRTYSSKTLLKDALNENTTSKEMKMFLNTSFAQQHKTTDKI